MNGFENHPLIVRQSGKNDVRFAKKYVNEKATFGEEISTPIGYSKAAFLDFLNGNISDDSLRVFSGEMNGEIIGMVWFKTFQPSPAATFALAITNKKRNLGNGKAFLKKSIDLYKQLEPKTSVLETYVGHQNIRSIRGLWFCGFRLNSSVGNAYFRPPGDVQDRLEFLMELTTRTEIVNNHDIDQAIESDFEINRLIKQVETLWPSDKSLISSCLDKQKIKLKKSYSVLDLGGGSGHFITKLREIFNFSSITLIDSSISSTTLGKRLFPEIDFVTTDILTGIKSIPSESTDIIVCRLVAQHCEGPYVDQVLFEANRVLRSDGIFFIIGSDPSSFQMSPRSPIFDLLTELRKQRRKSFNIKHDKPNIVPVSLAEAGFKKISFFSILLTSHDLGKKVFADHFTSANQVGIDPSWGSLNEDLKIQINNWENNPDAYAQALVYAVMGVKN